MNETPDSDRFRAWAVVPAKAFTRAKSRLHPWLPPDQRKRVARELLERVLRACSHAHALAGVLVATDGDDVIATAARFGAHVTRDGAGNRGALHAIVDSALALAHTRGATHGLVVMGDLPQLHVRDIEELLAAMRVSPFVIAPDAQRLGTSALGVQLDLGVHTRFGTPDSLHRHLDEAARLSQKPRLVLNPRIGFDLDTRDDLGRMAQAAPRR